VARGAVTTDPGFEVVYSIVVTSCINPFLLAGIGIVAVGLVLALLTPWKSRGGIFMFGGLLTSTIGGAGALECRSFQSALRTGRVSTVEGYVRDFDPMPFTGHKNEKFSVNEVTFSYSDYDLSPGFNQSASHGGPVHGGEWVRIKHLGNSILQIEVARR